MNGFFRPMSGKSFYYNELELTLALDKRASTSYLLGKGVKMKRIAFGIAVLGLMFSSQVSSLQADAPISSGSEGPQGYQAEKPVPNLSPVSNESLSPTELGFVTNSAEGTINNIVLNSPPGSDPFQEAKNTSEFISSVDDPVVTRPEVSSEKPEIGQLEPRTTPDTVKPVKEEDLTAVQDTSGQDRHFSFSNGAASTNEERTGRIDLKSSVEELFEFMMRNKTTSRAEKSGDDQEANIKTSFDYKLELKIREIAEKFESELKSSEAQDGILVLSGIEFTRNLRMIDRLANPPARLHP